MGHDTIAVRLEAEGRARWYRLEPDGQAWRIAERGAGRDAEIPRAARVALLLRAVDETDPELDVDARVTAYRARARTKASRTAVVTVPISSPSSAAWLERLPRPGAEWPRGRLTGRREHVRVNLTPEARAKIEIEARPGETISDTVSRLLAE